MSALERMLFGEDSDYAAVFSDLSGNIRCAGYRKRLAVRCPECRTAGNGGCPICGGYGETQISPPGAETRNPGAE